MHYAIKDAKRAIERYKEESAKLEEERDGLNEKCAELEALVQRRDEEIGEMEQCLSEKERLIQ